jgi:5-methylcytosine-specific restriction endonuclease McrA
LKDRTLKLSIELVPSTVWESSVYKLMSREVWDSIRNDFIKENGRKCQVCGETSGTMNLHEIWNYDDKKHVQKLEGFILLCRMCHHVKHIGLAGILANQGKLDYDKVIEHFCKVNDCTKKEFEKHKAKAFEIWRERSEYEWNQDFGKYKEFIKQ